MAQKWCCRESEFHATLPSLPLSTKLKNVWRSTLREGCRCLRAPHMPKNLELPASSRISPNRNSVSTKTECPDCGMMIATHFLNRHTGSASCKSMAKYREERQLDPANRFTRRRRVKPNRPGTMVP